MPFQPFVEALSALEPGERDEVLTQSPALAGLLASAEADDAAERADILSAVALALDTLAAHRPVMLVVEDAHWADASTRHLLQFLLARRFTNPVSLVVSYRSDDLHRRHPLRAAVAEWSRLPGVRRLELDPLDDSAVGAILRSREATRLSDTGATTIIRRAAGNAFYAEELLDAGLAEGALPGSLAELVLVRLDRLTDDARLVVGAVACAGGPATDAMLAEVVGLDGRSSTSLARGHRPQGARLARRLLRLPPRAARRGRARRPPARPASPPARVLPRCADRPGASGPGPRGGACTPRLPATAPPPSPRASSAGHDAVRISGHDEAAGHFRRALTLLDSAPDDVDVVGLVVDAVDALVASGQLRTAAKLLREQLDQVPESEAIGRGRLLVSLGNTLYYSDADDEALEASGQALEVLPDEPTNLRAKAEALRARTTATVHRYDEALEHADRAVSIAEMLDDRETVVDAQATLTLLLSRSVTGQSPRNVTGSPPRDPALRGVDLDKAKLRYGELIESSRAAGDVHGELRGRQNLAFLYYNDGDLAEAEQLFREGMARAEETGRAWAPYGFDGRFFAAVTAYVRGRWDDTLALGDVDPTMPTELERHARRRRPARHGRAWRDPEARRDRALAPGVVPRRRSRDPQRHRHDRPAGQRRRRRGGHRDARRPRRHPEPSVARHPHARAAPHGRPPDRPVRRRRAHDAARPRTSTQSSARSPSPPRSTRFPSSGPRSASRAARGTTASTPSWRACAGSPVSIPSPPTRWSSAGAASTSPSTSWGSRTRRPARPRGWPRCSRRPVARPRRASWSPRRAPSPRELGARPLLAELGVTGRPGAVSRPHAPRARGAHARQRRTLQRRDRGPAVHQHQDGLGARVEHPRQARCRRPHRGRGHRSPPRPPRRLSRLRAHYAVRGDVPPLRRPGRLLHRGRRRPRSPPAQRRARLGRPRGRRARRADRRLRLRQPRDPGRKLQAVLTEQIEPALALEPDLVTIYAGANDIMRPAVDIDRLVDGYDDALGRLVSSGAHLVVFTAFDPGGFPVFGTMRGRFAVYNELVREVAERHGATLVDFWRMRDYRAAGMWADDRMHMSSAGHQRMAMAVLDALARRPRPRPARPVARSPAHQAERRAANVDWARTHAAPWVKRRLTGKSSGDALDPRYPTLGRP